MFRKTRVVRTYEDHVVLAGDHFVVELWNKNRRIYQKGSCCNVNASCKQG